MHVHVEDTVNRSDCMLHTLSWMGKVPETQPDEEGWKLNRLNYYQEGWLATGNARGIVGATFSTCHCKKNFDSPPRTNFNLRGHRSEVVLVKWNEPYQKLATCDVTGVIFVWIKHEGRWSIELINDRNSQVTDFAWSHDGRMALICYRDGFVLVGSVAGQRYWSSMLNLDGCMITCGCWTPDDQKVLFGTTAGQVIVMSSSGAMLAQVTVQEGQEVSTLAWSCEKFFLGETEGSTADINSNSSSSSRSFTLAVCFRSGVIYLMSNYDDVCPKVLHTGLTGVRVEWSNDGEVLAVGGFVRLPNLECRNEVRFYTRQGQVRCRTSIAQQHKPITALTWGHNDRRLFVAAGCHVYTLWVTKKVASLQFCCRRAIYRTLSDDTKTTHLPLPTKLRNGVAALFSPTIKGYIPSPSKLREFVCVPPPSSERLHCTMMKHGDVEAGHYTLYLEYLGGLIPLLRGKRTSKLRPEFVVYDPKIKTNAWKAEESSLYESSESSPSDTDSDSEMVEGCGSPRMQRKRRLRKRQRRRRQQQQREQRREEGETTTTAERSMDDMLYDENTNGKKGQKLLEVTSNIWGTKFKIHGLASFLPDDLGSILYKTSLLHLQPRQMTISILELLALLTGAGQHAHRDPNYNPNAFSESEDDENYAPSCSSTTAAASIEPVVCVEGPPAISPEQPLPPPPRGLRPACLVPDQRHSLLFPPPAITDRLTPLEIRSLDGSPPQRRSPSLKSRSLSPAEATQHLASFSMLSGDGGDGGGAVPKVIKVNNQRNLKAVSVECGGGGGSSGDGNITPTNALNIMQMAAKKLETSVMTLNESTGGSVLVLQNGNPIQRWADRACQEIKFIDEDINEDNCADQEHQRDSICSTSDGVSAIDIMRSTQILAEQDIMNTAATTTTTNTQWSSTTSNPPSCSTTTTQHSPLPVDNKPRVILSQPLPRPPKAKKARSESINCYNLRSGSRGFEVSSMDAGDYYGSSSLEDLSSASSTPRSSRPSSPTCFSTSAESPVLPRRSSGTATTTTNNNHQHHVRRGSLDMKRDHRYSCSNPGEHSTSLPSSPVHRTQAQQQQEKHQRASSKQEISTKCNPPSHRRLKNMKHKSVESSDEEVLLSGDEVTTSENYKNLETFQKAQLSKKLRKVRVHSDSGGSNHVVPGSPPSATRKVRHFVLHNKAPLWNENSQVYQLDFGGRVTQESAKNFQIEFRGKQVMQFGRIDTNAYTLDFQYPFSAIQAFAVALANVTQRLK